MPSATPQKILVTISANQGELRGCDADALRVALALADFERWPCSAATRGRVFSLFAKLREALRPDATVVIYLSGHGGWARFPTRLGSGLEPAREWPFFVTADQDRSRVFTSLLAVELSMLVGWITRCTDNVTVITDTCFAPELVRAEPRLKSTGRAEFDLPDALLLDDRGESELGAWARAWAAEPRRVTLVAERVVCINAAGSEQAAYEVDDRQGRPGGAFTTALLESIQNARARGSCWRALVASIDARLRARWGPGFQRPTASGPDDRRLFSLETINLTASTSYVEHSPGSAWIASGRVHGTRVGDRFWAPRSGVANSLEVVELGEDRSRVHTGAAALPSGSIVYPSRRREPVDVVLAASLQDRPDLRARLAEAAQLRLCVTRSTASLYVTQRGSQLTIHASDGPAMLSDGGHLVGDLEALARARRFETACAETARRRGPSAWDAQLMRAGEVVETSARVELGDALWLMIDNHSRREVPGLYVNVVERGVDRCLRILNARHHPSGIPIEANNRRAALWYPEGPHGHRQRWPTKAPLGAAREVRWYLIASPRPLDLRALAVGEHADDDKPKGQRPAMGRPPPTAPRASVAQERPALDLAWSWRLIRYSLTPSARRGRAPGRAWQLQREPGG